MPDSTGFVIGYPWFAAEDYAALRALMVDGATMPATFAEWEQVLIGMEQATIASGSKVVRVPIRPMDFAVWCGSNQMDPDAKARNAYAAAVAQQARNDREE